MKALRVSAVILVAGLATACATSSDIEMSEARLQAQIDGLNSQVTTASADASKAQVSAAVAATNAAGAETAANRAAQYAQDTNNKLDRMFKQTMMK